MVICNNENRKFGCSTKENGFEIISDATIEKGGQGLGFRPHEILECAYASCLNMFTQMQCEKIGVSFKDILVKVDLSRLENKTIFNYSINFTGNITDSQKEIILKAIEESPVRKTLSKPVLFELKADL